MKRHFLKIYLILFINIITANPVLSEVFIIAKVNEEIITNIDIDFEKKSGVKNQFVENAKNMESSLIDVSGEFILVK